MEEKIEQPPLNNGGNFVLERVMKNSEYLYGVQGSYFKDMIYIDVIKEKIKLAKNIAEQLLIPTYDKRDNLRFNKVMDSIKFNNKILKELNGDI